MVNIVSEVDDLAAYGDTNTDAAQRYARTAEFMQVVRQLWTPYKDESIRIGDQLMPKLAE